MNKLICPKCGNEISNQFNATLSFCTDCGEKEIITSNTGKDTPEIKAILEAFKKLQNQTEFTEVK